MPVTGGIEYSMHGARAAMAAGVAHIENHIKALERAVVENPGLAFDLSRAIVESTCRTILTERKVPFDRKDDAPKLFKMAVACIPLLPATVTRADRAERSLEQTLGGLNTALQGICELRNECGFASHGSDGSRPLMETVQALFAAQTADAIIGFLHRMHAQERTPARTVKLEYSENKALNDYLDETYDPIRILKLEYPLSEVLFKVDLSAYRDALAEHTDTNVASLGEGAVASETGAP